MKWLRKTGKWISRQFKRHIWPRIKEEAKEAVRDVAKDKGIL